MDASQWKLFLKLIQTNLLFIHQFIINKVPNIIKGIDIANRTTDGLNASKKNTVNIPIPVISIPPASSHLHAIYTNTNKNSHGKAFNEFNTIPFIPPPYSSEPDNSAKTNQKIEPDRIVILEKQRVYFVTLNNFPIQ